MRKYTIRYSNADRLFTNSEEKVVFAPCKLIAKWKLKRLVGGRIVIHHIFRKKMRKHINKDFDGWFSFAGFYKDIIKKCGSGETFVEVGVYEGKSLAYFIIESLNMEKQFNIYGVDTFPGKLKQKFDYNMGPLVDKFTTLHIPSIEAAKQFENGSVIGVFIDASHQKQDVKDDIAAWLPKIKPGGFIAGHDYCPEWQEVVDAVNESFPEGIDRKYLKQQVWVKWVV